MPGAIPITLTGWWKFFFENLRHYQAGKPLFNVVDKRLGY